MIEIIGVKFRKPGKVYYFDPIGLAIEKGNHVIVETARGVEYGTVVLGPKEVTDDQIVQPLKPVIRIGTQEDAATNAANEEKEKEAFQICLEKIRKHELEMKLIDSEYTFDRNKLLFYFTADGRIDFRELVKDLASVFHTRIELRQIGVRDETKMIGGIAICGRPLCCHSYLSEFAPVSIKMAKEQNLSLNPAKISGVCGRLMCCLKNEQEAYEDLNRNLPNIGARTTTPEGYQGEVQSVSVLRQLVKVVITNDNGEKEVREYSVNELTFDTYQRNTASQPKQILPDEALDEEELIALEELSKEEETLDSEMAQEEIAPQRNNKHHRRRNNNFNNNKNDRGNRGDKEERKHPHSRGDRYAHGNRNEYNSHYHEEQQRPNRGQRRYHNRRPRKDSRDQKDAE